MNGKRSVWVFIGLVFALLAIVGAAAFWAVPGILAQTGSRVRAQTTVATAPAGQPRTITVVGEGSVKITPDIALANIGVETTGETVKLATAENSKIMTAVMAALKAQGIAEKDIQTSGFNVWVDRSPGPEGRMTEQVTYRVNNNVSVTIRDLTKVGTVLDAVIEAGANAIYGVSFGIAEPKPLMAQAREKAVADALAKAHELAKLNDVQVGPVVTVSEVVAGGGGYFASSVRSIEAAYGKGGGGAGPISPGEFEVTAQLQVTYVIE